MQLSPTYTFDKSGVYNYEAQGDPGVTMSGTITVVDNLSSPVTSSDGSHSNRYCRDLNGSNTRH